MPQLAQKAPKEMLSRGEILPPCLVCFRSCWRRPTRADRYKWLAQPKKQKTKKLCSVHHELALVCCVAMMRGQPIN